MPQPSIGQVHIDAILTNISVAYMQQEQNFIADKVFPIVPVDKRSNKYFIYTKNDWFRDEATRRAPGTESSGSGYGLSSDTYSCDVFAFHKDVDDQTLANSDTPLNPLRDAAEFVARRLMLRRENQFVADYLSATGTSGTQTSNWGTTWGFTSTGTATSPVVGAGTAATNGRQWSDLANSDPIDNIEAAKQTILSTTGMLPNTLVMGYPVYRALKNHPDLIDRIKYTTRDNLTTDVMAKLFDVDRVIVSMSVNATNNEGATAAYGFTAGKHALLCYVAPNPGLLQPSAGYQFSWTGVSGGLGANIGTSQFRMESLKSTRVEAEMAFDNKIVAADLGFFMADLVA